MTAPSQIIVGDCRAVLKTLPANSVQVCCTSPPYWGLRRYLGCPCVVDKVADPNCTKCSGTGELPGAEHELGSEPTPEAFIATMVDVFREVKRVLRDDGTCWLNLGSSYASGGTRPTQPQSCAPACGTDGIVPQDYPAAGPACRGSCGEHQAETRSHYARTVRTAQSVPQTEPLPCSTNHDSGPVDSAPTGVDALPRDAQASTTPSSTCYDLGAGGPEATGEVCPSAIGSSSLGVHLNDDSSACTCGTAWQSPTSVHHTTGTLSSGVASHISNKDSPALTALYSSIASLDVKAKDMIPMPWWLALALQADGWYLRSDIIWSKNNPMPESCTDRPTKAHEYIFLLTKRAHYFYDAEAVREPHKDPERERNRPARKDNMPSGFAAGVYHMNEGMPSSFTPMAGHPNGRNRRSVWTIPTQPMSEAHFATFPEALVVPCVKAGTSAKGRCSSCGKPWERIVSKDRQPTRPGRDNVSDETGMANRDEQRHVTETTTTGWQPGCECGGEPVPCVVLDPFAGSGTVGVVCRKMGLEFVGIELNDSYAAMARKRIANCMNEKRPEVKDLPGQMELMG